MKQFFALVFLFSVFFYGLQAQTTPEDTTYRIADNNNIGWYVYQGTFKLNDKWDVYTEYQWRRDNWIHNWMQSQIRAGVQYNLNKQASFLLGYSFINTYVYGDYPLASKGYPFPEHRTYQQMVLKNPIGRFDFTHRLRLEQRWIGQMNALPDRSVHNWRYTNRVRYMMRVNFPLKGNTLDDKEFYLASYDEIFVSFGDKVKSNIFDQNRFAAMLGFKLNSTFRIEGGFFQQMLQQGGYVMQYGKPKVVIQHNNGLIVTAAFTFDTRKWMGKKEEKK